MCNTLSLLLSTHMCRHSCPRHSRWHRTCLRQHSLHPSLLTLLLNWSRSLCWFLFSSLCALIVLSLFLPLSLSLSLLLSLSKCLSPSLMTLYLSTFLTLYLFHPLQNHGAAPTRSDPSPEQSFHIKCLKNILCAKGAPWGGPKQSCRFCQNSRKTHFGGLHGILVVVPMKSSSQVCHLLGVHLEVSLWSQLWVSHASCVNARCWGTWDKRLLEKDRERAQTRSKQVGNQRSKQVWNQSSKQITQLNKQA